MKVELKTLKDLDELIWVNGEAWGAIRQEAIRWFKYFESDDYFEDMNEFSTSDPNEVSGFIKHFFNITEEDLKC